MNVAQLFPKTPERLAKRIAAAMNKYSTGVSDAANGRQTAIHAVIEYGEGLLEGRGQYGNQEFSKWVTDNKFDIGKPWDDYRERTAAMSMAKLVNGSVPLTAFDACPYTRPTDIMKWYRKLHPSAKSRSTKSNSKGTASKGSASKAPPGTPKTDKAYDAIVERVRTGGDISNQRKFAKEVGVSHMAMEKAFDRWNREHAKETETTETEDQQLATTEFSDKSKLTIDKAIAIHKKRLDKIFRATVGEEVRRHIDAANDAMRKQNSELSKENLQLRMLLGRGAVFTPVEYRTILRCLHPDNSASSEVRASAFDLLKQKEKRLVGQL